MQSQNQTVLHMWIDCICLVFWTLNMALEVVSGMFWVYRLQNDISSSVEINERPVLSTTLNKGKANMLRKGKVSSTLMEAVGSSEMLMYHPTRCHMPEYNLHSHHWKNFKPCIDATFYHNIDILIWKLWLQYQAEGAGVLIPTLPPLAFII
jgi:hypothetical protein